jgi:hypothetical protein
MDLKVFREDDPMQRSIIWCLASLVWLAGLEGVLQLQSLPAASLGGHDVCGPWGCGPPTPVLLACHGFWLVLMGPPAVLAALRLPAKWVRRLGVGLVSAGLCGLVAVAAWEAATWLPQASAWQRPYIGQRYLFALVTLVDAPILQSLVIGSALCLARRRGTLGSPDPGIAPEPSDTAQTDHLG